MKTILITLGLVWTLLLTWCGAEKPMTEAQKAKSMWMSMEEYQENKEAAARMNMGVDEHMNMDEDEMDNMDSDMNTWM